MGMRFANEDGYGELNSFPGCNQIVVSNHAFIYKNKRGQGKGHRNHQLRGERAKFLGYDYLICTVKANNIAELKILDKGGFKELDEFDNSETGSTIKLYGKKIK